MNFAEMSWKEIQEALKKTQTILVPLSPLEQHGPHLPVSTDYFRAFEICKSAAEKTKVFYLPPIIAGVLKKGYAFPGGVSTSPEALKIFVRDIIESLLFTGFKKILIVSGHGGTTHNLAMREIISKF
ncbi:MAG: creatininase family protein, partial [Candidatus Diapherotrites archaeon]|nr:creatininase family protein [Candidatus Diapherotrites archaeon]